MDPTMVTKNIHSPSTLGLPYWQLSTLVIFFYITCVITLFIATLARCCEYISIHNSTTHVSPPLPPFSVGRVDVNCLTPCSRVNSSLSSNCHGNISLVIHPGDKHALACNKPIHQVWLLLSMYVHFTYKHSFITKYAYIVFVLELSMFLIGHDHRRITMYVANICKKKA